MNWFWLNIPLDAVFFLAVTGIPLWLVFRHPDTGPTATAPAAAQPAVTAPAVSAPAAVRPQAGRERELAGAAR